MKTSVRALQEKKKTIFSALGLLLKIGNLAVFLQDLYLFILYLSNQKTSRLISL